MKTMELNKFTVKEITLQDNQYVGLYEGLIGFEDAKESFNYNSYSTKIKQMLPVNTSEYKFPDNTMYVVMEIKAYNLSELPLKFFVDTIGEVKENNNTTGTKL